MMSSTIKKISTTVGDCTIEDHDQATEPPQLQLITSDLGLEKRGLVLNEATSGMAQSYYPRPHTS